MASPPPTTLPELIEQLGRTYSPFERLKILGRAWSLLRQMNPDQRLLVAAQLGLDNADEVVHAIAERSGKQASPALLSMIERAQVKGTSQLPQLLSDIKDPAKRAARLREGVQAVEQELIGGDAAAPWLPPAIAAPATAPPPKPAARRPPAPPPFEAMKAPSPAPAPVPAPAPAPAPPPVQTAPPPPVQAALPPEPKPVEAPAPPPQPKPAPVAAAEPRPEPVRQASPGFTAELDEAPTLLARFRILHEHREEIRKMPSSALRPLLEGFPDGWARRRALGEILRAGAPADLSEAPPLLEALGAQRDRVWCLGALTHQRQIPEKDREALLAGIDSPLARRRLQRSRKGT
ncbi:MAG TPA: hypothetical protein VF789_13040 [Thermoanaerobaculia bacterium]